MPKTEFTKAERNATLIGAMLALFLAALNQTIVATATPDIVRELAFPTSWITWIATAYLVTSTATLPIWGKLSDLYGRRNSITAGIVLFCLAGVFCALAQSPLELVLARALQGVGGAAIMTNAMAVIGDLFTPEERPRYQGLFGAVFGVSSVIGPAIGGILTDLAGWHWIFLVNLPVAAVALTFVLTRMPTLRHTGPRRVDYLGASLLLLAVIPLLLALALAPTSYAWSAPQTLGMFALSGLSTLAFGWHQWHSPEPIIELRLFLGARYGLSALASFLIGAAFFGILVFLPLYMVNALGTSATASGASLIPLMMGIVFGNIASGQLVSRVGAYKPILIPSLLLLMAGVIWMALSLSPDQSQLAVTTRIVLLGIGLGPSMPLFTQMMINSAPADKIGMASSAANFTRQLGSTLGVAVMGTLFAVVMHTQLSSHILPAIPDVLADYPAVIELSAADNPQPHLDLAELKTAIDARYAALDPALTLNDEAQHQQALAAADQLEHQLRGAWSTSMSIILWTQAGVILLGLIVTGFIPEMRLQPRRATASA
ncbi:MDR family MFS transporter [Saccharospirillum mangrovi]|uniref:MDR family MFS transporter n=1 Tax=Saccharospirillum mangrovi TaxID=2161747 RepID=UPI000D3B5318|nr:MDR family MFS transporter [Saccharospirillum mangrovi]